mgnify:CR=1 FL=1|jgi:hypothetical protein
MNFFTNKRNHVINLINNCIKQQLKTLDISNMELSDLPLELKDANCIEILKCDNNKIKKIENIPSSVKSLSLSNNKIEVIENLNTSLDILFISNNKIKKINNLPNINFLACHDNNISSVTVPNTLQVFLCSHNQIHELDNLNNVNVKTLDCSYNNINKLNRLPYTLETLDCSYNENLTELTITQNINSINCTKTPNLYKVNPQILLVENLIGINDTVVNCIRNLYADKIQKNARTFLCKKNYMRKKLIKHINIISTFPPNVNPQALKIYFINPYCKIASHGIKYKTT